MVVEQKPRVTLSVDPPLTSPSAVAAVASTGGKGGRGVNELLNANVTLVCLPAVVGTSDNNNRQQQQQQQRFAAVRWFLDGELLRQVSLPPKCLNGTNGAADTTEDDDGGGVRVVLDDCKIDPSKIRLMNVRRLFGGNYSCQGRSAAAAAAAPGSGGWGAESAPAELKVLYPPRGAALRHRPAIVRKGAAFQVGRMRCCINCLPVGTGTDEEASLRICTVLAC